MWSVRAEERAAVRARTLLAHVADVSAYRSSDYSPRRLRLVPAPAESCALAGCNKLNSQAIFQVLPVEVIMMSLFSNIAKSYITLICSENRETRLFLRQRGRMASC